MPKPSLHTLIWSHQQQHYELHMHGQVDVAGAGLP
jgi:hypothetical protein